MSYYTFNMKKGKYRIEMVSDDVYFAGRQVDKLFADLLKTKGKMRVVLPPLPAEKEPVKPEKPEKEITEIEETPSFSEESKGAASAKEKEVEEKIEKKEPPEKKAFNFKDIIRDNFTPPDSEEESEEELEEEEMPEDDDKNITKILEEKIIKNLPPAETETVFAYDPDEEELEEVSKEDYAEFLREEPEEDVSTIIKNGLFNSLEELISLKTPESKLDYLLVAAYYLQTKESLFKYSLKQLNSKIMPFLGALIDHSVIHNAVAHDFIEVVPDYNGVADVTEYRLTEEGENYLFNE